jgi:hypothetical protein
VVHLCLVLLLVTTLSNGSGEGTLGSAVDWVTTHLAERFAIPTAPHALINIEEDFSAQTNHDEMRDIIA